MKPDAFSMPFTANRQLKAPRPLARSSGMLDCYDKGVLVRTSGDILALSPRLIDTLKGAIQRAA